MKGKRLAQYEVLDTLGIGGMGTVYRARVVDRTHGLEPGDQVALKVVHPQLLEQPGFFKRFLREAEIGQQVSHENVVRTHDCDALLVDGRQQHFLVMELVNGQTLRGLLDEMGTVPEELCRHVAGEIARGLTAIHAVGVVHRDLKPENVLITGEHQVKVMDLGVAHLQDEVIRLSKTGAFVGSIEYAAPEQFRRSEGGVDARADLHALGVLLYELSTGRHPFRDEDTHKTLHNVLEGEIRPAGEVNPRLSAWFEEVVRTLTEREPERRFASATVLLDVLEAGEGSAWWGSRAKELRARKARPLRRLRIARDTAMYGRDEAMAKLVEAFAQVREGEGRVVLIEGEAGIGKTRLVDEFVAGLRKDGETLNFLFGSYPPGGAATAAGAFSTAYREQFGVEGLEETLGAYLDVTPLLVPAFAALLRGDATPEGTEPLTKDSLQTVFVHATRSLAAERPTIILIDDLHFAPADGRALFTALAAAVPDQPVLLIGTMRRGVSESWISETSRFEHASQILLPRLGPKDLARLLEDAFQSKRLAKDLDHLVSVKSDGNPFFAFEIIRGLREGNFIQQKADGTWISTGEFQDLQVPSSVLDLVDARVADLTEEERDLVDVAACCGFEFDPCLVADAIQAARIPSLKRFARIDRKHRLVRTSGHDYAFDHHQVQEALYGRLMPQLKQEYHAALGDALAARDTAGSDDPTALDGVTCVNLCEHHLRGSRPERSRRYLEPALAHLQAGYVNDSAIALAARALAIDGLLEGSQRVRVLHRMCTRLDLLGRREEEAAALEEACRLAEAGDDPLLHARALQYLGGHYRLVGRMDEAEGALRRAVEIAREHGSHKREAEALGDLGNVFGSQGRFQEAREALEGCIAIATEHGRESDIVRKLGSLAGVLHVLGEAEKARGMFQRSLDLSVEHRDRQSEVVARSNLGMVLAALGRAEEAETHYEQALALAREIGDRAGEAHLHGAMGSLAYQQGRLEVARAENTRALALSREIGSPMGEAVATGTLGNVCYALGYYEEALDHYERTLVLTRRSKDLYIEVVCLTAQGQVDAWLGEHERSRARLDTSLEVAEKTEMPLALGEAHGSLALLDYLAGDREQARTHADAAIAHLEGGENAEELSDVLIGRSRLKEEEGDVDGALADLGRAVGVAAELDHASNRIRATCRLLVLGEGSRAEAEAAFREHAPRASVCSRLEARWLLWRATGAPAHLEEAHALLRHLRDHAPAESRATMIESVPLHRAIMSAWQEESSERDAGQTETR